MIFDWWAFFSRKEMLGTSLFFGLRSTIPASNQPLVTSVTCRAREMSTSSRPQAEVTRASASRATESK